MFGARKATPRHRRLGWVYAALMVLVNVSALASYEETGHPGPFHALSVLSLATVLAGVACIRVRRPAGYRAFHAYFMAWSWVGLLAAGASQLTTRAIPGHRWLAVVLTTLAISAVAAWIIHRRIPGILAARPWARGAAGPPGSA